MEEYRYADAAPTWPHAYLWPALVQEIERLPREALAGVDASESGIAQARSAFPACRFDVASAYDDLAAAYGRFPLVVSLEVVEHLYDPRLFARRLYDLTASGGTAIVSTPYHGYLKNLALAVTGRLDAHFTALWDGGHIKFFSIPTLSALLMEAGFDDLRFERVGRVPVFAKSMMAVARRAG
jgi:2-polyprenyl-6-hydroxyphenyl methylase/3-demethylubiquinone-9 3-methyltransferase